MGINDDLLISYLLGEATNEETYHIEDWVAENQEHRRRFNQFKLIWESSLELKFNGPVDADASLRRLKQKIATRKEALPETVPVSQKYSWMKIAAAVLLISGFAWLYTSLYSTKEMQFLTQGLVRTDTLSDGSVITLNKNSALLYPEKFRGKLRRVWLSKGEAFFNISPDKAKPFLINTGNTVIKVVGTTFNVKNKRGLVEVIVETGIVLVSQNGQTVSLRSGEKVSVEPGAKTLVKQDNPDHLYTYYRSKEFVADDTPLWRMVQVLNEAYSSHIIIGRKELNNLTLNTTFKDESLDHILEVIGRTFSIKIEKKNNQVILY
ncbi:FecR domain-containing protein [Pedobacter hartonius]|uniref:FecR family protein n=1 Tax=Pedobacter hartonius TaxID=425514 RepID=A0A1H4GJ26_9SPHI|nr:FecR domain-containing protein [Pedobacter hartonius]SEB09629.1 FecR family protein [Pedobacter hartonius]